MHYHFYASEKGKKMIDYIVVLQEKDYIVHYTVNANNELDMSFFCHEEAILEARRMSESLILDATYKSNAHRLAFINIVGTSNVVSRKLGSLATFEITRP